MYYVLKKDGVVVDIINTEQPDVNKGILDGTYDEMQKIDDIKSLKGEFLRNIILDNWNHKDFVALFNKPELAQLMDKSKSAYKKFLSELKNFIKELK